MKTKLKIQTPADDFIIADYYHEGKGKKPLVIFCHGFKGFKDWGGFPYMMEKFAFAGFAALSFNFTYNGVSEENPSEFCRLDLFEQNTFTRELEELNTVINYAYDNADKLIIDRSCIALIGHSRGGGITIIKASEDKRIKCLVTLSAVSSFDRYSEYLKNLWKQQGYIEAENQRTKQIMRLNLCLLEDLEKNKKRLDIISSVRRLNKPYLIMHGNEDISVSASEAREINNRSNKPMTEMIIIENTGHTFGVVHPFAGTTAAFERVIGSVTDFMKNIFNNAK